jgi:hypothetical protein
MAADASQASRRAAGAPALLRADAFCVPAALTPRAMAQPGKCWTLWVKRVGSAQYDDIEDVYPQQLVSTFKKRWLSRKKAEDDPSLVTLRLVKRGPGVPCATEEADAEVLEPRLTLLAAGLTHGSSLLAVFAAALPATTSPPPRPRFVQLLHAARITQPDEAVLLLAERHFPAALLAVFDAAGAADLYARCKRLPGTPTRLLVRDATGVTLNGPLMGPDGEVVESILVGTGLMGQPLVAKLLFEEAAMAVEREMCDTLQLAPWDDSARHPHSLVRASVVLVEADPSDQRGTRAARRHGTVTALLMPRYPACLAGLPQLSCHAIARGAAQLCAALQFLHAARQEAPWVHMDVKAANVMVDAHGNWLLADFGSCARRGAEARSCTEAFLPPGPEQRRPLIARTEYDYDMLLVLLVIEAHKSVWKDVLFVEGHPRVSRPRLQDASGTLAQGGVFLDAPPELQASFAACVQSVRGRSTLV